MNLVKEIISKNTAEVLFALSIIIALIACNVRKLSSSSGPAMSKFRANISSLRHYKRNLLFFVGRIFNGERTKAFFPCIMVCSVAAILLYRVVALTNGQGSVFDARMLAILLLLGVVIIWFTTAPYVFSALKRLECLGAANPSFIRCLSLFYSYNLMDLSAINSDVHTTDATTAKTGSHDSSDTSNADSDDSGDRLLLRYRFMYDVFWFFVLFLLSYSLYSSSAKDDSIGFSVSVLLLLTFCLNYSSSFLTLSFAKLLHDILKSKHGNVFDAGRIDMLTPSETPLFRELRGISNHLGTVFSVVSVMIALSYFIMFLKHEDLLEKLLSSYVILEKFIFLSFAFITPMVMFGIRLLVNQIHKTIIIMAICGYREEDEACHLSNEEGAGGAVLHSLDIKLRHKDLETKIKNDLHMPSIGTTVSLFLSSTAIIINILVIFGDDAIKKILLWIVAKLSGAS